MVTPILLNKEQSCYTSSAGKSLYKSRAKGSNGSEKVWAMRTKIR